MRKILISCITLLLLCTAIETHALSSAIQAVVGVNTATAGFCDAGCTGGVTFCWTPDSTTSDCSAGDTSATLVGSGALSGGKLVTDDGSSAYSFDTQVGASPEIVVPETGAVEFKINITTWVNTARIFKLVCNSGGIAIYLSGAADAIDFTVSANDGSALSLATANSNKTTSADLRIRAMWRESGATTTWIEVCNADGSTCTTATDTDAYDATSKDGEYVVMGNNDGAASAYSMWDIKTYSAWQTGWHE